MAPVARELSAHGGVLEPLQTAATLAGQIDQLRSVVEQYGQLPVVLVGFSWGAWLSYLVASDYPQLVKKLILISSGPFEERYTGITAIRLERLSEEDRAEAEALTAAMEGADGEDRNFAFLGFGALMSKADGYDELPDPGDPVDCRADIYTTVWPAAAALRQSGELLRRGEDIQCPVVAIHGDYDPHPAAGVQEPLSRVVKSFRFVLLEKCGHKPWAERHARNAFYQILEEEIRGEAGPHS